MTASELPPGWCEPGDLARLGALSSVLGSGDILVEIGVALGRSAVYLARHLAPGVEFYAVDPWRESWIAPTMGPDGPFGAFLQALRPYPRETHAINVLRTTSLRAVQMFGPHEVAMVFLDGDHSYDSVRADIAAWRPRVRAGGILCGHDYHSGDHPGVTQAVDEVFPLVESEGSMWWVQL